MFHDLDFFLNFSCEVSIYMYMLAVHVRFVLCWNKTLCVTDFRFDAYICTYKFGYVDFWISLLSLVYKEPYFEFVFTLRAGKRCTTIWRILCHWRLYVPSEWCLQEKGTWSYIAFLIPVSNQFFRHHYANKDGNLKLRKLPPQLLPPLLVVDKIQVKSCRVVNKLLNSEALKYNSVGGKRLSTIFWSWIWSLWSHV